MNKKSKRVILLGCELHSLDKESLFQRLSELAECNSVSSVFTPNSEMLVNGSKDKDFSKILSSADLLIPDGFGVYMASCILGSPLTYRSTGIDAGEFLLEFAAQRGKSVFFLGGKDGVASAAAEKIKEKYPSLRIATHHGYFDLSPTSEENNAVLKKILASESDIVFVCLGSPAQEKWIYENAKRLQGVSLLMGLGGSLDVWSGSKKRAPRILSILGLEWLYRTIADPSRLSRLPSLFLFPILLVKEKLRSLKKEQRTESRM